MSVWKTLNSVVCLLLVAGFSGCGQSASEPDGPGIRLGGTSAENAGEERSHEGWWCDEHGVPEEVCTRCNPKLVADFKAKGDWCAEHDRPESQCFICHPEQEAEFVALYEAKYGTKPPNPTE
jgi:hypothetical protein